VSWWWSWLLSAIGLTGLWLAGNRRTLGWQIGLAVQALWITYAIATRQWGFIAASIGYATVNARNLIKWRADRHPDRCEGARP
jgi:hypothetical protein